MLKWLLLILVCVFVFAYPDQAQTGVEWAMNEIITVVHGLRDLIELGAK